MPNFGRVVILVKENHTFDNYFGGFPGAKGDQLVVCPTRRMTLCMTARLAVERSAVVAGYGRHTARLTSVHTGPTQRNTHCVTTTSKGVGNTNAGPINQLGPSPIQC